jgi:glutamate transport system permease protein
MRRSRGLVLGDDLGPRAQRFTRVVSGASLIVIAVVVYVAVARFRSRGQLNANKWDWFSNASVQRFLLQGLRATLQVAAVAMVMALAVGALLALGRIAPQRAVRSVASVWVEFFRAMPLLLLILFLGIFFPKYGVRLGAFWFLAIALTAYNGAVLAEVFRAGIQSLERGQTDAAYALGMGWWQTMGFVVLPQAVRRMVPAMVSQLVTLLKDSSLGFVLPYEELLRRARILGESFQFHQPTLQALIYAAALYITVNYTLSRVAGRLEVRQRRVAPAVAPPAPVEDLAVLQAPAEPDRQ